MVGFCYGGKAVIHLIAQPDSAAGIRAAIAAHPSLLVKEEAAQIKRPVLFICAEKDHIFNADLRAHFEQTLAPTGLAKFIDYPGTAHGFVIRPDGSEHDQLHDCSVCRGYQKCCPIDFYGNTTDVLSACILGSSSFACISPSATRDSLSEYVLLKQV